MRSAIVVAGFIVCLLLPQAHSQDAMIGVFDNPTGDQCGIADNGPAVIPIYVVAHSYFGITGTQFMAPVPTCLQGASWISDTPVFSMTLGNSQTGVSIAIGSCRTGWTHVLTMYVQVSGSTESCCRWAFLPHPEATLDGIEFVDCDFNLFVGTEYPSFLSANGWPAPPLVLDRFPADGATDQLLDVELAWGLYHCSCALGVYYSSVYFGPDPDPPLVAEYIEDAYDPGPLEAQTTYYWKLVAYDSDVGTAGGTTTTPVWSFTTEKGVAVESTTWGRIKSLYGD